ncbi:MAG: hypothetical protein RLZZ214_2432 [Verrucomicrobiota bacterium]|jgi:hypothetical protein
MLSFMKPILACLAALLAFGGTSHGQPPAVIKTHLLTYAPAGLPADFKAFFRTADMVYEFTPSAGSLGIPVLYAGPQSFVIRSSKEEFFLPEDQLKQKPPLAAITLPPNADTALLICVADEAGKVRLIAYDVSSASLTRGSYRFFNFSSKSLSIILGDQRFTVAPRSDKSVNDTGWHQEPMALPLQIATITDDKAKSVYSNFWEHYPQRRNLLFLFDGHHVSDPIIFSSFDVDTPPKAAATP